MPIDHGQANDTVLVEERLRQAFAQGPWQRFFEGVDVGTFKLDLETCGACTHQILHRVGGVAKRREISHRQHQHNRHQDAGLARPGLRARPAQPPEHSAPAPVLDRENPANEFIVRHDRISRPGFARSMAPIATWRLIWINQRTTGAPLDDVRRHLAGSRSVGQRQVERHRVRIR